MLRSEESGAGAGDRAAHQPGVPAGTAESWRRAEAEVFSALLGSPGNNQDNRYEDIVRLVAGTANRLRDLGPSTSAFLDAARTISALVREVVEGCGLRADEMPLDLLGGAALALRHRELVSEQAAARRVDVLARARIKGVTWVVLEEAGDWVGDPCAPYRRLEADAATGRALLVTATPDDDFRTSRHAVQVLSIDLDSGSVGQPGHRGEESSRHPTATDREAAVTTLRERLSRPG